MAGSAAKKSTSRHRKALAQYAVIALLANVIFFGVRWGFGIEITLREWALLAFSEVTLILSGWSLVWTASEFGTLAATSLDYFGIACATLLLSSIWGKGWWVLVGVPAYLTYQWGGFVRNALGFGPKAVAAEDAAQAPAALPPSAGGKGHGGARNKASRK